MTANGRLFNQPKWSGRAIPQPGSKRKPLGFIQNGGHKSNRDGFHARFKLTAEECADCLGSRGVQLSFSSDRRIILWLGARLDKIDQVEISAKRNEGRFEGLKARFDLHCYGRPTHYR